MPILRLLFKPTPTQLFWLAFIYAVVAFIVGFLFAQKLVVFLALVCHLIFIVSVYHLIQAETARIPVKLDKHDWLYVLLFAVIVFLLIVPFTSGELVRQKSQLQQLTDIVPKHSSEYSVSGNRGSKITYRALLMKDIYLHCSENKNFCEKIYPYHGKTATVYYQPVGKTGLVYEIVVDNNAIYQFDQQLQFFQQVRAEYQRKNHWTLWLYVFPIIYWWLMYRGVVKRLPPPTEANKRAYELLEQIEQEYIKYRTIEAENQTRQELNQKIQLQDLGVAGLLSVIIGSWLLIIFLIAEIIFIMQQFANKKNTFLTLIGFFVCMLAMLMIILPYHQANIHREYRLIIEPTPTHFKGQYISLININRVSTLTWLVVLVIFYGVLTIGFILDNNWLNSILPCILLAGSGYVMRKMW